VCVPIDPRSAWAFDPEDGVPKLQQLLEELEQQQGQGQESRTAAAERNSPDVVKVGVSDPEC
jgi:hypothetical protein